MPLSCWHSFWSGVAEIVLGVCLVVPQTRALAAWAIIAMLAGPFMVVHISHLFDPPPGKLPFALLIVRPIIQLALIYFAYLYTY